MPTTRTFTLALLLVALPSLGLVAAGAAADEPASWKGKTIIIKRRGVKMGHTDDNGRQVYTGRLGAINYRVLEDREGWLQVRHDNIADWFDKSEAVLVDDAPAYFTDLIRRSPEDQWYARRGTAWRSMWDFDKGLADYAQAIRMNPRETAWYGNRAWMYYDSGDFASGVRDMETLLRLANPPEAWMYSSRGYGFGRLGELDKATADFTRAIRMDPESVDVFNTRGLMLLGRKEYDRAIPDFNTVLRINANHMWAYNNRGFCRMWRGEYAAAQADLEKAMQMQPEPDNIGNLAWLLATAADAKVRDPQRALALAKKSAEMGYQRYGYALGVLAAAYAAAGDFESAVRYQEKALEEKFYRDSWGDEAKQWLAGYRAKKPTILVAKVGKSTAPAVEEPANLPKVTRVESGPLKGWREFKAPDGSFTIAFPELPTANKQRMTSDVGKVDYHYFTKTKIDVTYLAGYFEFPRDGLLSLDTAASRYTTARKGRVTSQKNITVAGHPARELTMTVPDGTASRIRYIDAGKRHYQLVVDGPLDQVTSEVATAYLDSFRPVEKE